MTSTLQVDRLAQVAIPALDREYFDEVYAQSHGDPAKIPWATGEPHPALVAWLNAEAPCLIRPGSRVAVVGSGLGDDAAELAQRGFDIKAFEWSTQAIKAARRRLPNLEPCFRQEDLTAISPACRHRFDLVVEINTLSWIAPEQVAPVARGIVDLIHPNGLLLVIAPGQDDLAPGEHADDYPRAFSCHDMTGLFREFGLEPTRPLDDFFDDQPHAARWIRGTFRRSL